MNFHPKPFVAGMCTLGDLPNVARHAIQLCSFMKTLPYTWERGGKWPSVCTSKSRRFFGILNLVYAMFYCTLSIGAAWVALIGTGTLFEKVAGVLITIFHLSVLVFLIPVTTCPDELVCLVRNSAQLAIDFEENFALSGSRISTSARVAGSIFRFLKLFQVMNMSQFLVAMVFLLPPSTSVSRFVLIKILEWDDVAPWVFKSFDFLSTGYFYYLNWCGPVTFSMVVIYVLSLLTALVSEFRNPKYTDKIKLSHGSKFRTYMKLQALGHLLNRTFGTTVPQIQVLLLVGMVVAAYAGVRIGGALGAVLVITGLACLGYVIALYSGLAVAGNLSHKFIDKWKRDVSLDCVTRRRLRAIQPLWIRTPFYFIDNRIILTMLEIVVTATFNALVLGRG